MVLVDGNDCAVSPEPLSFAGVVPVVIIDGREISRGRGPMVERLQRLYADLVEGDVAARDETLRK